MNLLKKAAVSLAATSMVVAPVAASAATAVASVDGARSVSTVQGKNELLGGSGWLIGLLALVAIVGAVVVATGNNDDAPTSP